MKAEALRSLRRKLGNNEPVFGLWITLESGSITEMAVASGLDWVVIDAEHGHLGWTEILEHIRAAVRSNTVVLVRIAELNEGLVKRVLDIGADGVLIPHIETAEELRRAMSYAKYPPSGIRGIGAERATGWGQCMIQHIREGNDNVLVIPIIESLRGGDNIKAMLEVAGTDIFFFGPADYSASAGHAGQWEVPLVTERMAATKNQVLAAGKYCGIVASDPADIMQRIGQGFRMVAYGFDSGLILKGIRHISSALGKACRINPSFFVEPSSSLPSTRGIPPPQPVPDRFENIRRIGEGLLEDLAPGVYCEIQVGNHNGAVDLFTAIVTFEPGDTILPVHTHPHSESITLISGHACVDVEDRRYKLNAFDNITIPKNCMHCVRNLSEDQQAIFHIAMPSILPKRELVDGSAEMTRNVPDDFSGNLGRVRVTRQRTAQRYASGPSTEFIDFFNESLIPGIGMSGGYALFHQGGRLPAHFHDFDESICIVEGQATCLVEGREYVISDLTTALQPRGRVHYFVNHSPQPMAMIWVYAGPLPERVEVDDDFANVASREMKKA